MCIWKLQFVLFHRCSCVLYCPGMSALCALSECVNIRQEQICAFTHRLTATCCMREHTAQSRVTNSYSRGELWKNFVLKYIHWVRPNTLSTLIFAASIHCVICITSSYSQSWFKFKTRQHKRATEPIYNHKMPCQHTEYRYCWDGLPALLAFFLWSKEFFSFFSFFSLLGFFALCLLVFFFPPYLANE